MITCCYCRRLLGKTELCTKPSCVESRQKTRVSTFQGRVHDMRVGNHADLYYGRKVAFRRTAPRFPADSKSTVGNARNPVLELATLKRSWGKTT